MNKNQPPSDFTGLWVYKCPSSGNIYEWEYVKGVEHGKYQYKLSSGVVIREGEKQNGLDHGAVIISNSEGKQLDCYNFNHGTGTHLIYNTAGTIGWVIPYKNGKQHGTKCHYINGKVVSEQEYNHGKPI